MFDYSNTPRVAVAQESAAIDRERGARHALRSGISSECAPERFKPPLEQPCEPYNVAFLLVPQFSMMAFTSAVEPLRTANRLAEAELFRWQLVSPDGAPVAASNGAKVIPDAGIESAQCAAAVVVCAGLGIERYSQSLISPWLRSQALRGTVLGGICTGSILLARAGLLDTYRCTVHWENVEGFVEEFPSLDLTATLYEIDRDRFTCSGGTAPIDMMLFAIHERHGPDLALRVAEQLLHTVVRHPHDVQRMSLSYRTGLRHPKLLAVIAQMEAFLENPVSVEDLGRAVGLSKRHLERLFRVHLSITPKRYYLELRLKRARLLLRQTAMPIIQVAVACGFTSGSHFAMAYRTLFGRSPSVERSSLDLVA